MLRSTMTPRVLFGAGPKSTENGSKPEIFCKHEGRGRILQGLLCLHVKERIRWVQRATGVAAMLAGAALMCTVAVRSNEGGRTALELPVQEGEFVFPDTRRSEVALLPLPPARDCCCYSCVLCVG